MAENPAQQIVEVVGDAAGEGPDPLQAARLPQTAFQSRALRFHRMTRDGVEDGVERHAQQTEFTRCRDTECAADRVKTERRGCAVLARVGDAGPTVKTEFGQRISGFTN